MRKLAILAVAVLVGAASPAVAQTCLVCVPEFLAQGGGGAGASGGEGEGGGGNDELLELESSLAALGFTFQRTLDPTQEACQVYVSHPGNSLGSDGPNLLAWVQAGNGLVQISDWGPDHQVNDWRSISEGGGVQVDVVDGSHPITENLPAGWSTFGFWRYGFDLEDYIGFVTDLDTNLATVTSTPGTFDRGLSTRNEGSGRLVYIGWNVYGSVATPEDLIVLRESIEFAGQCLVPVELESFDVE